MNESKLRKCKKNVFLIIGILLLLIITCYVNHKLSSQTLLNISSREEDFKPIINEYTSMAEFYYNDFKKYDAKKLIYLVPDDHNDKITWCITEGNKHSLELSDEQFAAYIRIDNSYYLDKHSLEYICVYDGFVSFCNDGNRASYVYSVKGDEPEYISDPDNLYKDIVIKKISEHWYWVCKRK